MAQAKPASSDWSKKVSLSLHQLHNRYTSKDYQKDIILIISIALASFLYLSIFSYQPFDPSFYTTNQPSRIPQNLGGVIGSYLTGFLIYQFGIISILFPLPLVWYGIKQTKGTPLSKLTSPLVFGWCLIFIGISCLLNKYLTSIHFQNLNFPIAGNFGITVSLLSTKIFGQVGHDLICISVVLIGFIRTTEKAYISKCLNLLKISRFPKFLRFNRLSLKNKQEPISTKLKFDKNKGSVIPNKDPKIEASHEHLELLQNDFSDDLSDQVDVTFALETNTITHSPSLELKEEVTSKQKYAPPSTGIFQCNSSDSQLNKKQKQEFEETAQHLINTLSDFNIEGEIIAIQPGPVVAVYEFQPKAGTKLSKVTSLIDDIALALKVDSIFILPVSGKRALGIQVPNKKRETVYMGDILNEKAFIDAKSPLTFAMGKSLNGQPVCEDLAAMPHLLMAGQTGSGKSVAINTFLCSILMKSRPDQVRFIMVDPKILELKIYEGIPHLLMPVITEASRASLALKWACHEMDRRYELMELAKVRNLDGFNKYWQNASLAEKRAISEQAGIDNLDELPLIVVIIDELADLMLTAPKDVEGSIQRLAQKARASGIHLVLATQRPSVDVITGVIKANLPCRCSFKVFSRGDSRTILDSMGAERLLGKGDMLFLKPGVNRLERIQGAFLDDQEVTTLVNEIKKGHKENYDENAIAWIEDAYHNQDHPKKDSHQDTDDASDDPKWDEALNIAQSQGHISASYLQRSLKIGYNRAARLVDAMFSQGLISAANGSKTRKWIGLNNSSDTL